MFLEIELKLHIEPADANLLYDCPFILEHAQGEPEVHYLTSIYYDTPDFDLRKNDLGFRIRECEQRHYQTVKSSGEHIGDLHHRHEWENEIKSAQPDLTSLEPAIKERVEKILAHKTLQPVFKTEFQRTTWQLHFADGGTQVELALDFGNVGMATQSEQISEIELELKTGDVAKLHEIAAVLRKSIPLTVEKRSKAARGYHLCSRIEA